MREWTNYDLDLDLTTEEDVEVLNGIIDKESYSPTMVKAMLKVYVDLNNEADEVPTVEDFTYFMTGITDMIHSDAMTLRDALFVQAVWHDNEGG